MYDKTMTFSLSATVNPILKKVLTMVYDALKEKRIQSHQSTC